MKNNLEYYQHYAQADQPPMTLPRNRMGFTDYEIRLMFEDQKYKCWYCETELSKLKSREVQIDHVIPIFLGGKTNYRNCIVACGACNSRKGAKTLEQFLESVNKWMICRDVDLQNYYKTVAKNIRKLILVRDL